MTQRPYTDIPIHLSRAPNRPPPRTFRQKLDGWMAGRGTRLTDTLMRGTLRAASQLYKLGVAARNLMYDTTLFKPTPTPLPVISVGNITAGGTGKSPFVIWLVDRLRQRGYAPAIVSRGYGARRSGDANDEIRWMRDVFDNAVPVIAAPKRYDGVLAARQRGADLVVLDDGFQHRQLRREMDIVLLDATNPFGYGYRLPRGLLRESPAALKRADAVVITRVDQVSPDWLTDLEFQVHSIASDMLICHAVHRPLELVEHGTGDRRFPIDRLEDKPIVAACAIGNPRAFGKTLRDLGADIRIARKFPDHYHYTPDDIRTLLADAERAGARAVVITEKDAVKFPAEIDSSVPVLVLEVELTVTQGASEILACVAHAVSAFETPDFDTSSAGVDTGELVWEDAPISQRTARTHLSPRSAAMNRPIPPKPSENSDINVNAPDENNGENGSKTGDSPSYY